MKALGPVPPMPLAPDLVMRLLDRMIYDRLCFLADPRELPELEAELTDLLEEVHRPGDPPAKVVAIHLILVALHKHDEELAAMERELVAAQGAVS